MNDFNAENINEDSIKLLRECDAGARMGIESIDDVLDNIESDELRELISHSRTRHIEIQDDITSLLKEYQDDGKEPAMMATMMAKMKTEMKMMIEDPDKSAASLIVDGCNMSIKSISKYLNKYSEANDRVRHLVDDIIAEEEKLSKKLRAFL